MCASRLQTPPASSSSLVHTKHVSCDARSLYGAASGAPVGGVRDTEAGRSLQYKLVLASAQQQRAQPAIRPCADVAPSAPCRQGCERRARGALPCVVLPSCVGIASFTSTRDAPGSTTGTGRTGGGGGGGGGTRPCARTSAASTVPSTRLQPPCSYRTPIVSRVSPILVASHKPSEGIICGD